MNSAHWTFSVVSEATIAKRVERTVVRISCSVGGVRNAGWESPRFDLITSFESVDTTER